MPVQTSHPGVYIQELPSGDRTISAVSTSVTAFVGATRRGPTNDPTRVTSMAGFRRHFGGLWDEDHALPHAVSHFFANGGTEAVIVRVPADGAAAATAGLENDVPTVVLELTANGEGGWATVVGGAGLSAVVTHDDTSNPDDLFTLRLQLREVDAKTGEAALIAEETHRDLSMSPSHHRYALTVLARSDLVDIAEPGGLASADQGSSEGSNVGFTGNVAMTEAQSTLRVSVDGGPPADLVLFGGTAGTHTKTEVRQEVDAQLVAAGLVATASFAGNHLTITSDTAGRDSRITVVPAPSNDAAEFFGLGLAFGGTETSGAASLRPATGTTSFSGGAEGGTAASGQTDGIVTAAEVVPAGGTGGIFSLSSLRFPRFNLLCLPDVPASDPSNAATALRSQALSRGLSYCAQERAFLIVDTPADWPVDPPRLGGLTARGEHGAIYYPRVEVVEPGPGGLPRRLNLPASGAVAGTMARTDTSRGVWKAPAGFDAGLTGISGLTALTNDDVSGVCNPLGVNVLRSFPGAGTVVWGARTLRGDDALSSEHKYVPIRRLTNLIASSLYIGTHFAVFEPNDPDLWAQLRSAVTAFIRRLYQQGAFQESVQRAESDSFFVVCDETVNTPTTIALGEVHVVVGFAPLRPAEFVIVTITQMSQAEE